MELIYPKFFDQVFELIINIHPSDIVNNKVLKKNASKGKIT